RVFGVCALASVVTSSILWDCFTLLWHVFFGENLHSKKYVGCYLSKALADFQSARAKLFFHMGLKNTSLR
ncbi:hypothetical protein, partial [uncultured Desulfovibrio sp.]|uniref:hypothetical protein n=1 Tax=uncultured Desulfovibrio sp. TaxID=167968 RepID=UPI0025FC6345